MPNRKLTLLQKIDVTDYGMNPSEQVTAAALKLYFQKEPEKSKQALEKTVLNRVFILNLKNPADRPILLNTDIDGAELASLIDTAKAYAARAVAQQAGRAEDPTAAFTAGLAAGRIDGKTAVCNVSTEFLGFLTDCCWAVFK